MAESTPTFEEIVKAWVLEYDERLPNDRRERREAFIVLLGNLHDHGYGKEEFNTSRKEKIVRSCVNPNLKDKGRLKRWVSMVVNDLDSAVLIYYGTIKIRRDVITPEMSAKLESIELKAAEVRALRKPDSQEEILDDSDKPLDIGDNATLDIYSVVKEAVNNPAPPTQEIFEITDDMFNESDGPEVVWDEDFMKKLESDNE